MDHITFRYHEHDLCSSEPWEPMHSVQAVIQYFRTGRDEQEPQMAISRSRVETYVRHHQMYYQPDVSDKRMAHLLFPHLL